MNKPTPFLTWVWNTQRKRIVFIHLVLLCLVYSLITDRPTPPWDIVGWLFLVPGSIGYWAGNYWYWVVRLKKGAVK